MADAKNVITLGIGAAPGKLLWFFTSGLESAAVSAATGLVDLTLPARSAVLTLEARTFALTLPTRDLALTLEDL